MRTLPWKVLSVLWLAATFWSGLLTAFWWAAEHIGAQRVAPTDEPAGKPSPLFALLLICSGMVAVVVAFTPNPTLIGAAKSVLLGLVFLLAPFVFVRIELRLLRNRDPRLRALYHAWLGRFVIVSRLLFFFGTWGAVAFVVDPTRRVYLILFSEPKVLHLLCGGL